MRIRGKGRGCAVWGRRRVEEARSSRSAVDQVRKGGRDKEDRLTGQSGAKFLWLGVAREEREIRGRGRQSRLERGLGWICRQAEAGGGRKIAFEKKRERPDLPFQARGWLQMPCHFARFPVLPRKQPLFVCATVLYWLCQKVAPAAAPGHTFRADGRGRPSVAGSSPAIAGSRTSKEKRRSRRARRSQPPPSAHVKPGARWRRASQAPPSATNAAKRSMGSWFSPDLTLTLP